MAAVVEVVVGDGADGQVVSLQDWADDTVHLSHHQARVGRDAHYKHVAVSFGGDVEVTGNPADATHTASFIVSFAY